MKGNQITSANHWRHVCQELFSDGRNGWKQDMSEALFNDAQVADVTTAAGREGGLFILLWSVTFLWQIVCGDSYSIISLEWVEVYNGSLLSKNLWIHLESKISKCFISMQSLQLYSKNESIFDLVFFIQNVIT